MKIEDTDNQEDASSSRKNKIEWYLFYFSLALAFGGAYYLLLLVGFEFENTVSGSNQQKFQTLLLMVVFVPIWISLFLGYLAIRKIYQIAIRLLQL